MKEKFEKLAKQTFGAIFTFLQWENQNGFEGIYERLKAPQKTICFGRTKK